MLLFNPRRQMLAVLLATSLAASPAHAFLFRQLNASETSAVVSMLSVAAPVVLVSEGGKYVVESIEKVGNGSAYVLRNASDGVRISFDAGIHASGYASLAVGQSVEFVASGAGKLMVVSGKVLAIIPDALGRALLKSDRIS